MKQSLEIIKESIIIGFKKMIEYKINTYSALAVIILDMIFTIFALVIINQAGNLNFSTQEIVFYTLLRHSIGSFFTTIGKVTNRIFYMVQNGKLNTLLIRPSNTLLLYIFEGVRLRWALNFILITTALTLYIIYEKLNIINFIIIFLVSFIFGYLYISMIYLWNFLGFFHIDAKPAALMIPNRELAKFPPTIFTNLNYQMIFYIFPLLLYGISTLYYFNKISTNYFITSILITLILSIIINTISLIVWKIGLKRYEGMG